jgi:hypothetical protein
LFLSPGQFHDDGRCYSLPNLQSWLWNAC